MSPTDPGRTRVPIVIVGGGPVGLSMAMQLHRFGIGFVLVERSEGVTDHPKARGVDIRSMELFRRWGVDPWTEGYITSWRPGDVMAVGPLHGTHEPPFYVCGSDQWVAGYMEGAVRTGRGAAAAALGLRVLT